MSMDSMLHNSDTSEGQYFLISGESMREEWVYALTPTLGQDSTNNLLTDGQHHVKKTLI